MPDQSCTPKSAWFTVYIPHVATPYFLHAVPQKVDFVLLGGDLFHDNKPSRQTVVKAMEIFARHCMSDDPVSFRVISDQLQNFASG